MLHKPVKVRAYMRRLDLVGEQPEAVFAGSGLAPDIIEHLEPMPDQLIADLFDCLARRTPAGFALECGRHAKINDLGMLGFRLLFCNTVRQVFSTWERHSIMAHPPFNTLFEEREREWSFIQRPRMRFSQAAMRFCADAALTSFFRLTADLMDHDVTLRRLELPFAKPVNGRDYEALGFREVIFDADDFSIVGIADILERRVGADDPDVHALLEPQFAAMIAMTTKATSWCDRVTAALQTAGPPPTMAETARKLNISARSLHRELAREGASYRDLLDQHRQREAGRLRAAQKLPLKELAWRLGFASTGSYRRWAKGHDRDH